MTGHTVGYLRVSSFEQNEGRQLAGLALDRTFIDKASGKDVARPQLRACLEYLRQGDTLMVHSLDRLARNAEDLLRTVRELNERGVSVRFVNNGLNFDADSADAMGRLMLTMLAAFAEFERNLLRERQREGIELAKRRGVYKGRKRALDEAAMAQLRQRVAAGESKTALAKAFGISRETLYQYLRQAGVASRT